MYKFIKIIIVVVLIITIFISVESILITAEEAVEIFLKEVQSDKEITVSNSLSVDEIDELNSFFSFFEQNAYSYVKPRTGETTSYSYYFRDNGKYENTTLIFAEYQFLVYGENKINVKEAYFGNIYFHLSKKGLNEWNVDNIQISPMKKNN